MAVKGRTAIFGGFGWSDSTFHEPLFGLRPKLTSVDKGNIKLGKGVVDHPSVGVLFDICPPFFDAVFGWSTKREGFKNNLFGFLMGCLECTLFF